MCHGCDRRWSRAPYSRKVSFGEALVRGRSDNAVALVQGSRVYIREMARADVEKMALWPRFTELELSWANIDLRNDRERDSYFERNKSNALRKRFVVLLPPVPPSELLLQGYPGLFESSDLSDYPLRDAPGQPDDSFRSVQMREEVIGTVGIRNINPYREEGTLGIIIRADMVGHGYGRDAIRCILSYSFDQLGLRRIILDVAEDNSRAIKCYEGIGFSHLGGHIGLGGKEFYDMEIYRETFSFAERMAFRRSSVGDGRNGRRAEQTRASFER